MNILGIETSCDETSAAVVEDGTLVLSNVIATSAQSFEHLGGVIPESAARKQVECILPVIEQALKDAKVRPQNIDAIAVTKGPGLLGSLLVGVVTARVLASLWKKPLIGVHHTLGHLSSTWLCPLPRRGRVRERGGKIRFPILALSVSGGHTELWHRKSHTKGKLLGSTRDDAAGEAFDKGASLLGLPYPGGPSIAKAAEGGNPHAFEFPLPLKNEPTLDFSFSGLKTALKYLLQRMPNSMVRDAPPCHGEERSVSNHHGGAPHHDTQHIAASYQHAICRHLIDRLKHAYRQYPDITEIHIVGGVSANTHLRTILTQTIPTIPSRFPLSLAYCTDNAAMIAAAGFFMFRELGAKAYMPFETEASPVA